VNSGGSLGGLNRWTLEETESNLDFSKWRGYHATVPLKNHRIRQSEVSENKTLVLKG
jgi:hypothetical protein